MGRDTSLTSLHKASSKLVLVYHSKQFTSQPQSGDHTGFFRSSSGKEGGCVTHPGDTGTLLHTQLNPCCTFIKSYGHRSRHPESKDFIYWSLQSGLLPCQALCSCFFNPSNLNRGTSARATCSNRQFDCSQGDLD